MGKEKTRRATFDDLIAKKLQKEKDQLRVIEIKVNSMDATLLFKKPKDNTILNVVQAASNGGDMEAVLAGYKEMIYHCCDMLQDTKLHEELGITDPYQVVDVLFDIGEVMGIGEQLADTIDIEGKVEAIKN